MTEISVAPAAEKEIADTVKVMGGEDLKLWVDYLAQNDLLSRDAVILAYSYIGPGLTHDIYLNGTVGAAKDHLKQSSDELNSLYKVRSYISVNKALVTQSSAAIPVLPLYISILFKVMKEKNIHEGYSEQIYRLFKKLETGENLTDGTGYIRIDDWEMREDVQREVAGRWARADDDNLSELADLSGYRADFIKLFGFGLDDVDYSADADPVVDETALGIVNLGMADK
jgi:enoyl-[acyl-carrier protein] reductase/trans-2-enoyl-CoA reductase (NAD+)